MSAFATGYNKAFKCIEHAKCYEKSGQLIEAKKLYVEGIENFMEMVKYETNTSRKQLIMQNVTQFMRKAEAIQKQIKHNQNNVNVHIFMIAQRYLDEANEFDRNNNYNEALNKYKTSSQLFLDGIQNKNNQYGANIDPVTKNKYRQKISKILDRIEFLQLQSQITLNLEYKKPIISNNTEAINLSPTNYQDSNQKKNIIPNRSPINNQNLNQSKKRFAFKPKFIKKESPLTAIPQLNHSQNKIAESKQESYEAQECKQYADDLNLCDHWSSDDFDDDKNDENDLILLYATHFKLLWTSNNNSNALQTIIFEPVLGENEYMFGHLATNQCRKHKLLIIKKNGRDMDALKSPNSLQCIYCINNQISFFRGIPPNGYACNGHIALKMECKIGEYIHSNHCPKFKCIKNKYFLSKQSKLRNIRNIIYSSQLNHFYIYQQIHFNSNILSPMFCKYGDEKPTENELFLSLNPKYFKRNEKPFYNVIKAGFLHKKCKLKRKKKRYYVLTNENIFYCYNINDMLMKQIDLNNMVKCEKVKANNKGFIIYLSDKNYPLEICQENECVNEWIEAIKFGHNEYDNHELEEKENIINELEEGFVETKGSDILIITDYTSSKSQVNIFAERVKKFEEMLIKIENMSETGENQKYAIESYVNLVKMIRSINKISDQFTENTYINMVYIPTEIVPLTNKTNDLLSRTINIIINDIKWAANPNMCEYGAARLTAACTICSELNNGQQIVSQYIIQELLQETKREFTTSSRYAKLEYIDRRFAEFRRKMKKYIEIYKLFVPEFWYLENVLVAQFCILTCESLEKQLSFNRETIDEIVNAKKKCLQFENELTDRYSIQSCFFPKISDILELHLNFDCEVVKIQNILINSKKKENMNAIKAFLKKININININKSKVTNKEKYLKSFDELSESINKSIETCFKKSNGEPLLQLIFNFALILEKYAFNLAELLYISGGKSQELKEIIPKQFKSKTDNYKNKKHSFLFVPNFNIRSENENTHKHKIQIFVIYCCLIFNTCIKVRDLLDNLLNESKYLLIKELQKQCAKRLYQSIHLIILVEKVCLDLMRSCIMYQFEAHLFKKLLTRNNKQCKSMLLKEFDTYLLNPLHLLRKDVFCSYFMLTFCGFFAKSFFDIILGAQNVNDFDVNQLFDFIEIFQISVVHFLSIKCLITKSYKINKIKYKIEKRYMNSCQMLIKLVYADIENNNKNNFINIVKEIYHNNNSKVSFKILQEIPSYQLFAIAENENDINQNNQNKNYGFRLNSFSPIIPIQIKMYNKWECIHSVLIKRKFSNSFQLQIKKLCQ